MKRILLWTLVATLAGGGARSQDAATQQQIDKLSGSIQDILASQEQHGKRLDDLAKRISTLAEKVNTTPVNDSASREDLKALAAQVQEIDKKRQDDRDLILKEIKEFGKVSGSTTPRSKPTVSTSTGGGDGPATEPAIPQKGYEYPVQAGDTIGAIAKAYRDQGVKVTSAQILKANPKLDPSKLIVGQKIFIPDPSAK